jgi:hypothetical protein
MWLKTFSVYLALEAGVDVLFQDGECESVCVYCRGGRALPGR